MKIIIKRRSDDFVAYIEGHPGMWESGNSSSEAIGKIIVSHSVRFGITFTFNTAREAVTEGRS